MARHTVIAVVATALAACAGVRRQAVQVGGRGAATSRIRDRPPPEGRGQVSRRETVREGRGAAGSGDPAAAEAAAKAPVTLVHGARSCSSCDQARARTSGSAVYPFSEVNVSGEERRRRSRRW
ncbi:MAG: hypothetical protein MZV65_13480 [Chromatiales bacterium]|nr:hypothetical protein [Chromatiales bacterium]